MEAQWKLRYSQEGLKKSTEKSRLAKSLLWFKQGTRPVVTSHFANEAWGWGGNCWGGVCQLGLFSVFRLPSVSLLSLFQGLGGGKAGEGGAGLQSTSLLNHQIILVWENTCLPGIRRMLLPTGIWEENQSNLLSESQALHLCLIWGGGARWHLEPVWTGKKIHMGQYATWKLQEGITECSFKSVSVASNFLY